VFRVFSTPVSSILFVALFFFFFFLSMGNGSLKPLYRFLTNPFFPQEENFPCLFFPPPVSASSPLPFSFFFDLEDLKFLTFPQRQGVGVVLPPPPFGGFERIGPPFFPPKRNPLSSVFSDLPSKWRVFLFFPAKRTPSLPLPFSLVFFFFSFIALQCLQSGGGLWAGLPFLRALIPFFFYPLFVMPDPPPPVSGCFSPILPFLPVTSSPPFPFFSI